MGFEINKNAINKMQKAFCYTKHTGTLHPSLQKYSGVLNPSLFNDLSGLHGINPRITFPATGKSAELPRFITEEMQIARKMNQIAVAQIKEPVNRQFLKATAEDFKRLTDTSYEASNMRCVFTNPENGEVFHLLSEGKTEEGLNIIRVLDKDGAYLKTINVKPKKVVILDNFDNLVIEEKRAKLKGWTMELSHGDLIEIVAKRNNPFADYEIIDASHDSIWNQMSDDKIISALKNLQRRIDNGEQIDLISFSFGTTKAKEDLLEYAEKKNMTLSELKHAPLNDSPTYDICFQQFKEKNPNIRMIQSAGNEGKDYISGEVIVGDIEGVGSIGQNGKITGHSAGRNSLYTQHLEPGEFEYTATPYGYSLTGGVSTEIPFTDKVPRFVAKQQGNTLNLPTEDEIAHIKFLRQKAKENNRYQEELDAYMYDLMYNKHRLDYPTDNSFKEYELFLDDGTSVAFRLDRNGKAMLCADGIIAKYNDHIEGTSLAAPARSAKIALWEMLKGLI